MGLFGILKHVLAWPATAPGFLVKFSLEQVEATTLEEVADDAGVREELFELQLLLELGEIDEEEYEAREAELMRRFREVREWRRSLGLPTRGGPIGLVGPPAGEDGPEGETDADRTS